MNIWSHLHFFAFTTYFVLVVYIIAKNYRSILNISAALLFGCFAVWSLGNAILYNSYVNFEIGTLVEKLESPGWILFSVFYLMFLLAFTRRNRVLSSPYFYIAEFVPVVIFIVASWSGKMLSPLVEVSYGLTAGWTDSVYVRLYYVFYITNVVLGMWALIDYRVKIKNRKQKELADIILITISTCFVFGTTLSVVLKELQIFVPFEGTLIFFIFAFGVIYAMAKYEFLMITPHAAAENIISTMKDCLILMGRDGSVVSANKAATFLFECGESELENCLKSGNCVPPDFYHAILEGEKIQDKQVDIVTASGRERKTVISSSIFKEDDEIVGYVVVLKDITDIIDAENKIIQAEKRFKNLIESANEWIWETDETGVYVYSSPGIYSLLGYRPEVLIGKTPPDILPCEQAGCLVDVFAKIAETKGPYSGHVTVCFHKETGKRVVLETNGVPVFDENGAFKGCRGATRDITLRKEFEEKLEQLINELQRSNTDLERFAYVVSHDLKEPLRMISVYVDMLKKKYSEKLDKDADDYIGFASGGTKKMAELIDDLLAYSRAGRKGEEFTDTDLNQVLDHLLNILKFKMQDSGALVKIEGKLPVVAADSTQMRQVFQNIIENGIKFNKSGKPEITVSAEKKGKECLFSIKDNGIGINNSYSEQIFEIFNRLHSGNEFEGTGVGLAICKKIIERHNGKIWAESEGEGKGTTFFFTLPVK